MFICVGHGNVTVFLHTSKESQAKKCWETLTYTNFVGVGLYFWPEAKSPDVINTNTAGIMFLFHSNHSSQLSKNQNMKTYLRFDVLVAIKLSLAVFLVVLPYSFVYGYQHFRSTYHLHLQPWKWRWYIPLILWNPLKITWHHNPEWPESTWKECFYKHEMMDKVQKHVSSKWNTRPSSEPFRIDIRIDVRALNVLACHTISMSTKTTVFLVYFPC
jgi:hypothetical protein